MESGWIEVSIDAPIDAGELLALLDDPSFAGAWQEDGVIHLYCPAERWSAAKLASIQKEVGALGCASDRGLTWACLPEQDWNARWAASVEPLRVGQRVVIRPSWKEAALRPGDIELVIDPKQAFGTGHHATTQLLIERLEELIRGGEHVVDVGTGSGILAMVALRLGAASALGIDSDPTALACAREYARLNGFGEELQLRGGSGEELGTHSSSPADVLLANLDRKTLLTSGTSLLSVLKPGAVLVVSGILVENAEEIAALFTERGGVPAQVLRRDEWVALEFHLPESCEG